MFSKKIYKDGGTHEYWRTCSLVDDDINICEIIRMYLEKDNFQVSVCHDGKKAVEAFKEIAPDIVILDIMLPGMDGWQVCREIRKFSAIPIIMLSAKDETFNKVLGLELGADDYMVKPFEPKELIARIRAVLRRYEHQEEVPEQLVFPGLVINKSNYTVKLNGNDLDLPPKELELLFFLASFTIRYLHANSFWKMSGALISMVIQGLLMSMLKDSGRNSSPMNINGRLKLYGELATNLR
jgi:DNA-binding response OmpR family regulator